MTSAKPRPPLIPGETRVYPLLPLRDIVVFPHMITPLFVGRKKSILALEEVIRSDAFILLATQKNASDDDPGGARPGAEGALCWDELGGELAFRLSRNTRSLGNLQSNRRPSHDKFDDRKCMRKSPVCFEPAGTWL